MKEVYNKKRDVLAFLIILSSVISCINQSTKKEEPKNMEKLSEASVGHEQQKKCEVEKKEKEFSKENFYGVWAENEEDNALYVIEKDSLYFIEHLEEPISYFINMDTLYFDYGDFQTYMIILKADEDSLFLKSEYDSEILKLYKR